MSKNKLLFVLSIAFLIVSCNKNDDPELLNGTYRGSFYYSKIQPAIVKSDAVITLELQQGNTYQTNGSADRKPAGGSGEFVVSKNNRVDFTDKNVWTADFNWNYVLNGEYTYETKGDSLILTRRMEICKDCLGLTPLYQYRLKRIY